MYCNSTIKFIFKKYKYSYKEIKLDFFKFINTPFLWNKLWRIIHNSPLNQCWENK